MNRSVNATGNKRSVNRREGDDRCCADKTREMLVKVHCSGVEHRRRTFHASTKYQLAYTLTLMERRIIGRKDGAKLLKAILRLERGGSEKGFISASADELTRGAETRSVQQMGDRISAPFRTAAAWGDSPGVAEQLVLREKLLDVIGLALRFAHVLADLSHRHANDVMPYYTWLQQAEPITLGYFFSATLEVTLLDVDRLWASYEEISRARSTGWQVVPTSSAVPGKRLLALLGFSETRENSLDCYNASEVEVVLLNVLTTVLTHACRMSDDLYVWTTQEFGLIEFGDAFSGTSFIMPHKKNPHALRFVRLMATRAQSAQTIAGNVYMNVAPVSSSGSSLPTICCFDAIEEVSGCFKLLTAALPTITFNAELGLKRASEHYAQSVQLVSTLVTEEGISFRTAHHVVGHLVREALERGLKANEISLDMLRSVARRELGRDITLAQGAFKRAFDPVAIVASRLHGAGPAPRSMSRMVRKWERAVGLHEARYLRETARIAHVEKKLRRLTERAIG